MQNKIRSKEVCLMCGKPSVRLICLLCASRLRKEALREEIEDERQGKRPTHLSHTRDFSPEGSPPAALSQSDSTPKGFDRVFFEIVVGSQQH